LGLKFFCGNTFGRKWFWARMIFPGTFLAKIILTGTILAGTSFWREQFGEIFLIRPHYLLKNPPNLNSSQR